MFTVDQIEQAHSKVKSGADFPKYIQTEYFGENNFRTASKPKYAELIISENSDGENFKGRLKEHQQGKTDYFTFCKDCAETGIEKWIVNLHHMTCIYYDKIGTEILVEQIPQV